MGGPFSSVVPEQAAPQPFKGLAYFDEGDQSHFGGRERDIAAVTYAILRSRTFLLYGRSGLGKTSLLLAGVLPELRRHGCVPVYVRTLEDPLADLQHALAVSVDGRAGLETPRLIDAISEANGGQLVSVVFDQFEEFFIRFSDPDATRGPGTGASLDADVRRSLRHKRDVFIDEVGRLAGDPRLNLRLVWSLREDWIAEMQDFARTVPSIMARTHRLTPLSAFGVRESIIKSLRASRVEFDAPLISELVDTLADYSFDPAVLQVLCSEVWKKALAHQDKSTNEGPPRLSPSHLEAVGGVEGVFRSYLDSVTTEIPRDDKRLQVQVRAVLDSLISDKRTKRAMKKSDIRRQGFAIKVDELDRVLEILKRRSLVREDVRGGESWFELIHERLVEIIMAWLDSDRDYFNFRAARNLVDNSCDNPGWEQNPALLLNPGQLDGTVGPFKDLLHFTKRERLFLLSSATFAQSKDLVFWAEVAGEETSAKLLEHLLTSANEQVRARAAEGAGRVKASTAGFCPTLLNLALEDPSEPVRRAAGRSFAQLASELEFAQLAERLKARRARDRATDALADVIDADRLPSRVGFGRWRLWRARRRLFRRRLRAALPEVGWRSRTGAVTGLLASVGWLGTAGVIGSRMAVRELNPADALHEPIFWAITLGLCVLFGLPLGTLVGWLAARRAARDALYFGEERGPAATMGRLGFRVLALGGLIEALLILFRPLRFAGSSRGNSETEILVASATVALAALFVWSGIVSALARGATGAGREVRDWLRAWPWAFGGSLLLPLGLWTLAGAGALDGLSPPSPSRVSGVFDLLHVVGAVTAVVFAVGSATVGGLLIYVGILAQARTSPGWAPPRDHALASRPGPWVARPRSWVGLALCAIVLALYYHDQRFDALLGHVRWIGSEPIDLVTDFGGGPVDAEHFTLVVGRQRAGQPRIIGLEASAGVNVADPAGAVSETNNVLVATGRLLQLAVWSSRRPFDAARVRLQPDGTSEDELLESGRWHLAVVRALRDRDGHYGGSLRRRFADRPGPGGEVSLSVAQEALGGPWCEQNSLQFSMRVGGSASSLARTATCQTNPPRLTFPPKAVSRLASGPLDVKFEFGEIHPYVSIPHAKRVASARFIAGEAARALPQRMEKASPDGLLILTASDDLQLWTVDGPPPRRLAAIPRGLTNSVAVSSSGRFIVSAAADGTAEIRDVASAWRATQQMSHQGAVNGAAFSHEWEHPRVVTASADGTARIWEGPGAAMRFELSHEGTAVWKATFSHNDRFVATASGAGAFLWSADTGRRLLRLPTVGTVYAVAFSPDDRLLLTAGEDRKVRIWSLDTLLGPDGRPAPDPQAYQSLDADAPVWCADFDPEGKRIVAGTSGSVIRFWSRASSATFEPERLVLQTNGGVWSVEFSPDGQRLVSGSAAGDDAGEARLWDLDPNRARIPKEPGPVYLFVRFGVFPRDAQ